MRPNRSLGFTARIALVSVFLVAPPRSDAQQQTADVFDQFFRFGDTSHKVYAQEAPGETIDPFTGTLRLVQEDLVLPGKGGLDLHVVRTYSSKIWSRSDLLDLDPLLAENARSVLGYGWSFHMGKLANPNAIPPTLGCGAGEFPVFEGPDGEVHVFFPVASDASSRVFRSKDQWRLEMNCQVLGGAGECVWSSSGIRYEMSNAPENPFWEGMRLIHPVTAIADANNNRISVTYVPSTGAVDHVEDSYGRIVAFTYASGDDGLRLDAMTANGKRYAYLYTTYSSSDTTGPGRMALRGDRRFLTEVRPPAGGSFRYEYGYTATVAQNQYALTRFTSPFGGVTEYAYESAPFFTGRDTVTFPVVASVTRGAVTGRQAPVGTWSYKYSSPPASCQLTSSCSVDPGTGASTNMHVTTVTRPDGFHDTFTITGFGFIADANDARGTLTYAVGLASEVARGDRAEVELLGWKPDQDHVISPVPYAAPIYGGNCGAHRVWDDVVWAPLMTGRRIYKDGAAYDTVYSDWDAYGQARSFIETGYQAPLNSTAALEVQPRPEIRVTTRTYFTLEAENGSILNMVRGRPLAEHICIDGACVDNAWSYDGPGHTRDSETLSGVTTRFGHDPFGQLESVTNALGDTLRLTDYRWGVARNVALNGVSIAREPTWEGWIQSETNGRGYTTAYAYDDIGRLLSVRPPGNSLATVYDYRPDGRPEGVAVRVTKGSYAKLSQLDALGRVIATTDSEGINSQTSYDAMGNVRFRSYPFGAPYAPDSPVGNSIDPDSLGRPKAMVHGYRPDHPTATCDGDGACAVSFAYLQNATNTVVERASTERFGTWRAGTSYGDPTEARLVAAADGAGNIWRYAYNVVGKLTSVTAPLPQGNRSLQYDANQFLRSETTAESGTVTFVPNAIGQVLSRTDARGVAAQYRYDDPLRRLTGALWGTDDDVARGWDEASNVRHVDTRRSGAFDYDHDEVNRPTHATWTFQGATYTTGYRYDEMGCLRTMTYPTGTTLAMTCDGLNRVKTVAIQRPGGAAEPVVSDVAYHPSGQAAHFVFGNRITTEVAFDGHARVSTLTATRPDTQRVAALSYRYDGAGNVVFFDNGVVPNAARTMFYDANDRLQYSFAYAQWGTWSYGYDALGNLTSKTLESAATGSTSTTSFVHDPKTNRLAYSTGPGPNPVALTWDSPGHLAASSDHATYVYDGVGRRIQKTETNGTSISTTLYHYDAAGRLIAETKPDGTKLRDYVYLGNKLIAVDGCVTAAPPAPCTERQWYHTDTLGSVLARTDVDGNVVAQFDYEAWGERWSASGIEGDRQYNGRVYDAGTGFHDYGARLYWPEIGRFISADSYLGDPGNPASLNRYSYVHNNPYKYTDPTGHCPSCVLAGIGFAVGGAWAGISSYQNGGSAGDIALAVLQGGSAGAIVGATLGMAGEAVVGGAALWQAGRAAQGRTPSVTLDTNAVIASIEGGEAAAVDSAMAGRAPLVPIQAAKEFLRGGGDADALREFLSARGGSIGPAASESAVSDLQGKAAALGRVLGKGDARVAGSAMESGTSVMTRDARFGKTLDALGQSTEKF